MLASNDEDYISRYTPEEEDDRELQDRQEEWEHDQNHHCI